MVEWVCYVIYDITLYLLAYGKRNVMQIIELSMSNNSVDCDVLDNSGNRNHHGKV